MSYQMTFPSIKEDPLQVHEWLEFVDDVFEFTNPDVDLVAVLQHVLGVTLGHADAEVRIAAYMALSKGLLNHPSSTISLRPTGERLPSLAGKELLWGMHAMGFSGDASLAEFLTPLLTHDDRYVRAEAYNALRELGLSPPEPLLRG